MHPCEHVHLSETQACRIACDLDESTFTPVEPVARMLWPYSITCISSSTDRTVRSFFFMRSRVDSEHSQICTQDPLESAKQRAAWHMHAAAASKEKQQVTYICWSQKFGFIDALHHRSAIVTRQVEKSCFASVTFCSKLEKKWPRRCSTRTCKNSS